MLRRIMRNAPGGGGTPTCYVLGPLPEGVRFWQVINPTSDSISVWWETDGQAPDYIATVGSHSIGALCVCPPDDTKVGFSRPAGALGSFKNVWIVVS
jgi:hypothetical protein